MQPSSLNKRLILILITVILLGYLPSEEVTVWKMNQDRLEQIENSKNIHLGTLVDLIRQADLNGDGKDECIGLREGSVQINNCAEETLWQSPSGWNVKEALISDLNRDGQNELTLLVWRPFQPWPIDRDDPTHSRIKDFRDFKNQSCHVILIHWTQGNFYELWAGSAMVRPVSQLHAVDVDTDGGQELVALEGYYNSPFSGGVLTVWRWRGFGFVLVDKKELFFRHVEIQNHLNANWIVTQ